MFRNPRSSASLPHVTRIGVRPTRLVKNDPGSGTSPRCPTYCQEPRKIRSSSSRRISGSRYQAYGSVGSIGRIYPRTMSHVQALRRLAALTKAHPRAFVVAQLVVLAIFFGAIGWAVRGSLRSAGDYLRNADLLQFGIGCAFLAAYYLLFVLGWMRILADWGQTISYPAALRAEMVSMLAKYVPGGVWTPAARVVATRRAGITDTGLVTASILIEAGVSAVAGVIVFVVSLATVEGVDAPLVPLIAFAVVVVGLLHPRIFGPITSFFVRKLGGQNVEPLRWSTLVGLLAYYSFTWVVGGVALFFLVRSVGGDPGIETVAFLGGVGAVGAIVAVLSVFAPSGLGPREASMYALLLAVTSPAAALGATVLNRLAITVVEVLLLVAGGAALRRHRHGNDPAVTPATEPSQ